jgi:3',5'-cyclic-AMP phosphodiesterase
VIIAHISDTHIQTQVASARSRLEDLGRTVASINALAPRPTAVLHTGDIAHDATPADYAAARGELSRLACPLYATIGNRDRRAPFQAAFASDGYLEADSGFVQFAVNLGALRIVAADTLDAGSPLGAFCPEREVDFRRLLDAHPGQPTLVFLHHSPILLPGVPGPLQYRDPERAAALIRRIGECPGVIGVFAGHVHRARTVALGGVTLRTVPSIAADLSKEEEACDRDARRPIYHLHTIEGSHVASARILVSRGSF